MDNAIIGVVILLILGAAIAYIIKAKKSGVKCIGCPAGGNCAHKNNKSSECSCGCSGSSESNCGCHTDN